MFSKELKQKWLDTLKSGPWVGPCPLDAALAKETAESHSKPRSF